MVIRNLTITLLFVFIAIGTIGGCGSGGGGGFIITPSGLVFVVPAVIPINATVGVGYEFSFCNPRPPMGTSGLCSGPGVVNLNPTGGQPPYNFQLGSGVGFPPFGLTLNLNGILSGTPTAAGTSTFSVCATDLASSSICQTTQLIVNPSPCAPDERLCTISRACIPENATICSDTTSCIFCPNAESPVCCPNPSASSGFSCAPDASECPGEMPITPAGQCSGFDSSAPNACGPCNTDDDCPGNSCFTSALPAPFCG